MRKYIKQNLLQLCGSVIEMHDIILKEPSIENRVEYFILCQQSAVAIGDTFAKHATNTNKIDEKLEIFCNNLLPLAQMQEVTKDDLKQQNDLINDIINIIDSEEITYEVVFLPYSASMWDSMASVYNAYKQKPNYTCIVVPIPYKTFDRQSNTWKDCYEKDDFPPEINAVHYSEYSLEKNAPEAAFIHNPYDGSNYVTRVYKEYYSENIKRNVGILVYIPYYVTTGELQEEHLGLSAYKHADYIIVQSKSIKEQFKPTPFYEKVLALGSPKLDAVVEICEKGGIVPQEWRETLQGKKALMLNTTIGSFLTHGEFVLNKLQAVFEYMKNEQGVLIIWRPHPLLGATIDSMRPQLRSRYDDLVNFFTDENIGILDTTPDITNTIAICDAYIGDDGSSVLNLFGIANKPVFIFNHYSRAYNTQEKTKLFCTQLTKINDEFYTTSNYFHGIYKVDNDFSTAKLEAIHTTNSFEALYYFSVLYNGSLYLSPLMSQSFYKYNAQKNKIEQILKLNEPAHCMKVLRYNHKIIYLPQKNNLVIIYDTVKNKFSYKKFEIPPVSQGEIIYYDDSYNFAQIDKDVYITSNHSNIITCFNMKKETFTLHEVGPKTQSYIDISFDGEYFWLAGVYKSEVIRWDKQNNQIDSYHMPSDFVSWKSSNDRTLPYTGLYCYDDYVYTLPAFSNSMVKINKTTKESSLYMPNLFEKQLTQQDMNGVIQYTQGLPIYKNENKIVLQNGFDGEIFKIDLEKDEVERSYITIDDESYNKVVASALGKSKGFFRNDLKETFCKRENMLFTFEDFIKDVIGDNLKDVKILQKQALVDIAENIDGSAGEKICKDICGVIEIMY